MDAWVWILLVVGIACVVVVAGLAWFGAQRRRTQQLRKDFGPVYDDTVSEAANKREAETELRRRQERVQRLRLQPLSAEDRGRFEGKWRDVQASFIEDPRSSVQSADALIDEALTKRGYPQASFDQRLDDLSVEHPELIRQYRGAREVIDAEGDDDTEALRKAIMDYRDVFNELMNTDIAVPEVRREPAATAAAS